MEAETILRNVREVAAGFAAGRRERQQRRALVPADFAQLHAPDDTLFDISCKPAE